MSRVRQRLNEAYDESLAVDCEFVYAVRAAKRALQGAKLRKAAADGVTTDLILWLLSDRPLDRGARRELASLLSGEMHTTGRPTTKAHNRHGYRELIKEAKARWKQAVERETPRDDAMAEAAEWAARDVRAGNKAISTIRRAMQKAANRL